MKNLNHSLDLILFFAFQDYSEISSRNMKNLDMTHTSVSMWTQLKIELHSKSNYLEPLSSKTMKLLKIKKRTITIDKSSENCLQ